MNNFYIDDNDMCFFEDRTLGYCHTSKSPYFGSFCPYIEREDCEYFKDAPSYPKPSLNPITVNCKNTRPKVFVFGGKLYVSRLYVRPAILIVDNITSDGTYNLLTIYNQNNERYYIPQAYWKRELSKHMPLNIDVKYVERSICSKPLDSAFEFNEFSLLALYGYKAGKSGLPQSQRIAIMDYLINTDIMNVNEIFSQLQQNINLAEARDPYSMKQAIKDWEDDINYLYNAYKDKKYLIWQVIGL